jgi:hypothetical protein
MGRKNFASYFFPDTTWDDVEKAEIVYSGRQGNATFTGSVRKPSDRWRGNPQRTEREVIWIDLSRIQPIPYRTGYLKLAKPQNKETGALAFDDDKIKRLSHIMGRSYQSTRMAVTQLDAEKPIPVIGHRGRSYSGFHSGAGELVAAELVDTDIPKTAIVLVDEIESSLHPRAQRRLMRDLAQLARLRDLQIIFTTQSPYVLEELPAAGRLYVADGDGGKTIISGISPFFAMTRMDDERHPECDVFVEDTVAEDLLREIIVAHGADILPRIRFIPYGPANVGRALGQMKESDRFPDATCIFVDGDQEESPGCVVLPGRDVPERAVFEGLTDKWVQVAQRVGRSASQVADCCEKAMTRGDSHEWINAAADGLLLKGNILWQAMCAVWATECLSQRAALPTIDAIRAELPS